MTHCKGCGGHIGSAPPTYGHILGCGHMEMDHAGAHEHHADGKCAWTQQAQLKILRAAFKNAQITVTSTQLDDFANKLGAELRNYS